MAADDRRHHRRIGDPQGVHAAHPQFRIHHARVIGNTGKPFTEANIGQALAMREFSRHLRETGESKGYNASFTRQDRSRFLQALEEAVQAIKREG